MFIGIIGSGNAAKRIIKILAKYNKKFLFNIYTNRRPYTLDKKIKFYKLKIDYQFNENFFFIANNTSDHFKFLNKLIKLNKNVYVEKPICCDSKEVSILKKNIKKSKSRILIGYQYRENNCIKYLKKIITKDRDRIVNVFAYSGENVKKYHEHENYKKSYTISKKKGGGVLLTQSHQIDYLCFLFGQFIEYKSLNSDNSKKFLLRSDVENNVSYLLKTRDGILINANLNYFGLKKTYIKIETLTKTYTWDDNRNTITINYAGKKKIIKFKQKRIDLFKSRIMKFLKYNKKIINKEDLFSAVNIIEQIKKNYVKKR